MPYGTGVFTHSQLFPNEYTTRNQLLDAIECAKIRVRSSPWGLDHDVEGRYVTMI